MESGLIGSLIDDAINSEPEQENISVRDFGREPLPSCSCRAHDIRPSFCVLKAHDVRPAKNRSCDP